MCLGLVRMAEFGLGGGQHLPGPSVKLRSHERGRGRTVIERWQI